MCRDWCEDFVPSFAWKWIPECCACEGGEDSAEAAPELDAMAAVSAESEWRVPSWCRFVPPGERHAACRGSRHGCSCHRWCVDFVPRGTWHVNPECCGCLRASASATSNASEAQEALGGELLPLPAPKKTQIEARTSPAWCEDIPAEAESRPEVCRGGENACMCRDWCEDFVPSFAWKWIPECCACEGGEDSAEAAPELDAMAAVSAESEWRVPSWCRFVPPGERHAACRGSRHGCSCHRWCVDFVPRGTWHVNPECCACRR